MQILLSEDEYSKLKTKADKAFDHLQEIKEMESERQEIIDAVKKTNACKKETNFISYCDGCPILSINEKETAKSEVCFLGYSVSLKCKENIYEAIYTMMANKYI